MTANPAPARLLSTEEAATVLGLKSQTLRKWRLTGAGPSYVRLGSGPAARAAYRPADLDAWLTARTFAHTAAETVSSPSRSS